MLFWPELIYCRSVSQKR